MSYRVWAGLMAVLGALFFVGGTKGADSSELDKLQGKWECRKTGDDGGKYILVLEINKDKLTFRILDDDRSPRFMARADFKLEKLGPFRTFTSRNIKAGSSEDALESVDDEYSHVYQIGWGDVVCDFKFRQTTRATAGDGYLSESEVTTIAQSLTEISIPLTRAVPTEPG